MPPTRDRRRATLACDAVASASAEVIVAAVKSELLRAQENRLRNRDRMRAVGWRARGRHQWVAMLDGSNQPRASMMISGRRGHVRGASVAPRLGAMISGHGLARCSLVGQVLTGVARAVEKTTPPKWG